jgi:hypothetical protein
MDPCDLLDINLLDELDIEKESIGKKDKHDYRVIMYNKFEVEYLEKKTMEKMLNISPTGPYSDTFLMKAYCLFPEKYPELANKKKRGKKSSNYFIEDVGKYLWLTWHRNPTPENRNDFLTYCYPLIDGVIFKYQRHKHGLAYEEIFQGAILKIINAMDKFDPERVVGVDDNGKQIFARIYTYFTMVLNYGITTITMAHGAEKITNISLENVSRLFGNEAFAVTDASVIFQDFLLLLETLNNSEYTSNEELITDTNKKVITAMLKLIKAPENTSRLVHNLKFTLKSECDIKMVDIDSTIDMIKREFGPLVIFKESLHLGSDIIED